MSPPAVDELERSLHARGRRMTRQRLAIYEVVRTAHDHPSAEEVFDRVRRQLPQVSLATVYNALEALVECGWISKVPRTDGGPARYDHRVGTHHHARCVECGRVWDIEQAALDVQPHEVGYPFKTLGYKVEMMVECPENCEICRQKN
jgi:Fe2+ or Zn2+ uptake regulation protein